MNNIIYRAYRLAEWAHSYQTYSLDGIDVPYIQHVDAVVRRVTFKDSNESRQIVAWLHDVVEDTSITLDVIRVEFSTKVTTAVDAITRKQHERGSNENYMDYILRLKENEIARFVKIHDLLENMSHCTKPEEESLLNRYKKALAELR